MSYLKGLADKVNRIEAKENFNLLEIDIDKLIPSTKNFYGIRELEELAESIKESGLMHNLVVRKRDDGNYEILSGERRYHALRQLGYEKVPCQLRNINDLDAEILLIQANARQRELTHLEKMEGINRLKAIYESKRSNGKEIPKGKTRDLIGKDIGLSGVQVGRYMKVSNKLIEPLKDKLSEGSITLTQADTLSGLKDEEQSAIHEQIKDMDVKDSKNEVDILVEGIRQPVISKYDKALLLENDDKQSEESVKVSSSRKESDGLRQFKEFKINRIKDLLYKDSKPKVVINKEGLYGLIETELVTLSDGIFIVKVNNGTYIKVLFNVSFAREVPYINYIDGKLTPKNAWQISDEIYLWFKSYI